MSLDMSQFIPTFLEESFEGIELMEQSLLALEPGDDDTINAIFRAAHSIKGGAGTFGFAEITEFTHLVETFLDEMRNGTREVSKINIELMLISVDCIRLLVEAARDGESCTEPMIKDTASKLEQALNNATDSNNAADIEHSQQTESTHSGWDITFKPIPSFLHTGNDPLFLFMALADLGETTVTCDQSTIPHLTDFDPENLVLHWQIELVSDVDKEQVLEVFEWVEDECELTISPRVSSGGDQLSHSEPETNSDTSVAEENAETVEAKPQPEPQAKASTTTKPKTANAETSSIRVGVDKVDKLINLVGELVITQSMLTELGNNFDISKLEKLNAGLEQLLGNTKELQESVMRIRMLPIGFAFNRFPRLIRDLSSKLGKDINLVMHGENTELDKTVMEQISDPLVHLVRNALDHGIENVETRLAAGKPAQGTIKLDAYHQGGSIVVEVSDDGGGINRDAVFNKAVERGLIASHEDLTDTQVYDLLFEPGFSTAEQLSDISGRGVGMDVVRSNIQSLGGSIQIDSTLGKGSTFKVQLPLTLAILDGQLVKVGSETYIIPLLAIVESLQIKQDLVNTASGNVMLYRLREDNVPIIPVHLHFGIEAENTDLDGALLVVVEANDQKVGLLVDDLLGQQQVVIKSLKENYKQVDGISGATILGDGSVSLILDIPSLIALASGAKHRIPTKHRAA